MSQPTPHPTPSGDGELRERICQAMWSLDSYAFDPDGLTSDEKRTVDAVLQLIAQECAARERAARIDELQMLRSKYDLMDGSRAYTYERIVQLTQAQRRES